MKKVAILYDFDKTLCTKDMQEYSLIPALGYQSAGDFWDEVTELSLRNHMDGIATYLYVLQKKFNEQGTPLKKEMFMNLGKEIVLYPGVDTWFKRINTFGREHGFLVEHYIISSGMREIIEGAVVADEFKKIYACRYYYEDGIAKWPAQIVNYTTKTQYIYRINKQVLDENEDKELNEYVEYKDRPVPFERMVYIADGITDIPCLKLVKENGGKSIAVYNKENRSSKTIAEKLVEDQRVNYIVEANYEEGSAIEELMKKILVHMQADSELEDLEGELND